MSAADGASLAPLVAAQLNYLRSHSPVSISAVQIRSGSKPALHADRFTLLAPFCFGTLKWDVIYNALHPTVAPDIVFSEGDSDFNPLDGDGLSWLDEWDAWDPAGLLNLVNEIRELYRRYQWKRVEEVDDARLKFEISAMSHREGIEVSLMSGPGRPEDMKFAVPLDIDLNKLAPFCPWNHQQRIYIHFSLPTQFPKQKPSLTLQSCQHFDSEGRPITSSLEKYPWSPRWEPAELVDHIFDFLVDECLRIKIYCSDTLAKSN